MSSRINREKNKYQEQGYTVFGFMMERDGDLVVIDRYATTEWGKDEFEIFHAFAEVVQKAKEVIDNG